METPLDILWFVIGLLALLNNIDPTLIYKCVRSISHSFHHLLSPNADFEIPEFTGYRGADDNRLYRDVTLYLDSTGATTSCRLTLSRSNSSESISISVADNHTIYDSFGGHRVTWRHNVSTAEGKRSFTLKIPKCDRKVLLEPYLKHVKALASDRRLYMNNGGHGTYEAGSAKISGIMVKTPERVVEPTEGSFSGSPGDGEVLEGVSEEKKKKIDCVSFGYEHKVEVEEEN